MGEIQTLKVFICNKKQNSISLNEGKSPGIRKTCVSGGMFPPFHNFVAGGSKSRGQGPGISVAEVGVKCESAQELHSPLVGKQ